MGGDVIDPASRLDSGPARRMDAPDRRGPRSGAPESVDFAKVGGKVLTLAFCP